MPGSFTMSEKLDKMNDNRPRKAIEAGRAWVRDEIKFKEVRAAALAAHVAACEAENPAAQAAARAAGHAAATAHVAGHARHAANYAVKAVSYAFSDKAAFAALNERRLAIKPPFWASSASSISRPGRRLIAKL